jgi:hypothetical protein
MRGPPNHTELFLKYLQEIRISIANRLHEMINLFEEVTQYLVLTAV